MFPTSSQRKYWTYANETEISDLRLKHNQSFVLSHGNALGIDVSLIYKYSANVYVFVCH